uniref:Protein kinase domain-containing protein n=1 Tax=Ditylenchus dipsaci TaxID=166011 RepID=A0A915EDB6_9BILA
MAQHAPTAPRCSHDRNLKPSNFLLDDSGYLLLTDFGLSHSVDKPCSSFSDCGTQDYYGPELSKLLKEGINSGNYKEAVDWYALGAIMFELVTGKLLTDSKEEKSSFANMQSEQIELPENFSEAAKDFLNQLLQNDPEKRLGTNGTESVTRHSFFKKN